MYVSTASLTLGICSKLRSSSDQIHQPNWYENQDRQEEAQEQRFFHNQWKVNRCQRIHRDKLHQRHHCLAQVAKIFTDDESSVFKPCKALILADYFYSNAGKHKHKHQDQCACCQDGLCSSEETIDQPPHDLEVIHHPRDYQQLWATVGLLIFGSELWQSLFWYCLAQAALCHSRYF